MRIKDMTNLNEVAFRYLFASENDLSNARNRKHLQKAMSEREFIENVLADESLIHTESYAKLSRRNPYDQFCDIHERRIFDRIGPDNTYYVISDTGSVRVGSPDFEFGIFNGLGVGVTTVGIAYDQAAFPNPLMMDYDMSIEGTFHIYDSDTGEIESDDVVITLHGIFDVYSFMGSVVFAKRGM